ncbi:hypothetical protein AB7952_11240 [Streptomyces sp. PG2]
MTTRNARTRLADTAGRVRLHRIPPNATAGQITHLRALAQVDALGVSDWPEYGSVEWLQLPPDAPEVYVATVEAAELHRMHVDRLYADAHAQAVETLRTAAETRTARTGSARTREPHKLTPTPGWPPIAIPGRPGEFLTLETSE